MKYLSINEIEFLNVDINCICNAGCPGCARQEGFIYKNPNTPDGKYMLLSTWKKIILPLKNYLKIIVLCGNYGEPGASPNLLELLEWTIRVCPNILKIQLDSNMGINNVKFWEKLGKLSNDNNYVIKVHASIDGLEDTNHIYRRFVKWDKVIKNLKAYNDAGGLSCWKMIKFPWNSHQHDEAQKLAKELGCFVFEFTITNNPNSFYDMYKENKNDWWNKKVFNSRTQNNFKPSKEECITYKKERIKKIAHIDEISCITKKGKGIHTNWDGKIWPCCWYGGAIYHGDPHTREFVKHETDYVYGDNWNNVNYFTLEEIMNSNFYTKDLMHNQQSNPSIMCTEVCGKCNDKWNRIHTRSQYSEEEAKRIWL